MNFSGKATMLMHYFLIPFSVVAFLLMGLQMQPVSPSDGATDTLLEVSLSNSNVASLPASIKFFPGYFYFIQEDSNIDIRNSNQSFDLIQSQFVNAFCRNAYYVFTSINAP